MLNVYVLVRTDKVDYDEYTEVTVVAENEKRALEMARTKYGRWKIELKADLNEEQFLTWQTLDG